MSEQKTLIEQLAQKRETFDAAAQVGSGRQNVPLLPSITQSENVVETRSEVIQQVESIERASRNEPQIPIARRTPVWTSSVKWFATFAVVVVGVCCFVYLPNPQNATPATSGRVGAGKIKLAGSDAQLAAKLQAEPERVAIAAPLRAQEVKAAAQAVLPEGTTITVTPVPAEISANVLKNENVAPVKTKAIVSKPKVVTPAAIAKAPATSQQKFSNQNSHTAAVDPQSPSSPAAGVAKPFELPAPAASKTAQEQSCSGTTGLAAEQCNQCASKSWLSRVNCEAHAKANYCAVRGRQTPDCTADYYTRG